MSQRGALYGSAAPPSGSFVNLGDEKSAHRGGANFHAQSIGFLVTPPLLLYAFMDITFAFLSGYYMPLAIGLCTACCALSFVFWQVGRNHAKGPAYMFVSILCFLAVANGVMSGLSVNARFYGPYWNYEHRPVYTDVLATDPAAARADGGIIGFASNAIVDSLRNGNLLDTRGTHFCVAPILDESQQNQAEFWAVGMDCCEGHVGFYCDDSQDVTAKTGAVVFNTGSLFAQDPYYKFQEAVTQAAARSQLKIPKNPVLVRWVKDPATITNGLWRDGTIHLCAGIGFYGLASAIVGFVLHAATSRGK